ncbi:MAG: hypothetical protein P8Q36_15565 [Alphaproteobacteria bacterium]|jgi:uncharacterized protein|nr:hypothetical protein [Rhodospirillaceae bacterium]MBT6512111.1 hypothetical protein [Rhodospirillaceae bacterium]MBT7613088.1 hypothetical protein [Rhodospirillaceae bacterium]MBT7646515.1 hypothetical protein [Rhodospirillaceae bacterium]MDG2482264.1 hypothetical protein [Alphaproteobacteria bacterium]
MTSDHEKFGGFQGIVTDIAEVTEALGPPMPQVLTKVMDHLDDVCRNYIAASPFCLLSSVDPEGAIDI